MDTNFKSGKFLDRDYKKFINSLNNKSYHEERLETYNIVVNEIYNSGYYNIINEFKYRVTDGENINKVLIDITSNLDDNNIIYYLKKRIDEYYEEDVINRFF